MVTKLLSRLIILFCLTMSANTFAQTAANDLADLLDKMQTLQADFTQLVSDSSGHIIQRSQGKLALQRPGKFSWQMLQPSKQMIIANQQKLWVYDVDLEQVTVQSLSKAIGATPALLLSNDSSHLAQDYTISRLKSSGWFKLIPKKEKEGLQSLRLHFIAGQLQEMQFVDNLGHTTILQLQQVRINAPISPTQFILHVPKNVDVIKQE